MILEEITSILKKALIIYREKNPHIKIVIPDPGEEDLKLAEIPANANVRIKEVIQLTKAINAIYLPFDAYIRKIECTDISLSVRGISSLRDEINKAIQLTYAKLSEQKNLAKNLDRKYPKELEREYLISEYCRAKHKFCSTYHKIQFDCKEQSSSTEENYGTFVLAEKYSGKHVNLPPRQPLAFDGELQFLKLGKEIFEKKTETINSFFATLGPENNPRDLNNIAGEIDSEIAHKVLELGLDFQEKNISISGSTESSFTQSPPPSIPRP